MLGDGHGCDSTPSDATVRPASGTSSKRSTSTRPRSVIFSDGITESERNASICTGCGNVTPSDRTAAASSRLASSTSASGRSERRPATGSGSSASTPVAARRRRGRRRARAGARGRDAASPRRRRRRRSGCGASWATVEPNAPRSRPKPRTKPSPTRPVCEVALEDGDLGEVARRVGDREAVADGRARRRATR